jgi:hypothetical protein
VIQNLVLNNSDFNFSAHADQLRASDDQTKVVPTAGTDAAVVSTLRAQLESSSLTGGPPTHGALHSSGNGINAEYSA